MVWPRTYRGRANILKHPNRLNVRSGSVAGPPPLPNYGEGLLRRCWPAHMRAIWELGALWAEWRRVYGRPRPPLADALVWHDRWLPGVAARLDAELAHCSSECREARRRTAA